MLITLPDTKTKKPKSDRLWSGQVRSGSYKQYAGIHKLGELPADIAGSCQILKNTRVPASGGRQQRCW